MFALLTTSLIIILAARTVVADPFPTTPDSKTVETPGETCYVAWKADKTGEWDEMYIQLMTGDNLKMVHLTTVGKVDGTKSGTYGFRCPGVDPPAPIYFYQFSTPSNASLRAWTTRFTITDEDGNTVEAPESHQPTGEKVPWGTGKLVEEDDFVKPPSYLKSPSPSASESTTSSAASSISLKPTSTRLSMTRILSSTSDASSVMPAPTITAQPNGACTLGGSESWIVGVPVALGVVFAWVV